ncbi:hypothetical protein RJ640_001578 [Escallonia rubra]|uniref:Reverse transcriptase Ty1/copia-type domain-containing protein n=1 Tax=Escallonia rubra TaxID=112253 RepID=A0AA88QSS3_9ASTE|nr:hypothetical protein RJ640_001578 [Escallonia rubra]
MLIVCLYVDDLIFTGNDSTMFDKFKRSMMVEFDMSDLGMMHYFLGIEVKQSAAGIFISQKKYVQEILDRFQMKNCNSVSTPTEFGLKLSKDQGGKQVNSTLYKQIVGSLMYLTTTRPDIMYSVSLISRYMENPTELHLLAAKRIFRYLKGTIDFGLLYKKGEKSYLIGFTDSDYAGDIDDWKSTSGYAFMLGSGAVSWSSKKQPIVTLSTTEAEFVAATSCACQAIWLRKILEELHFKQEEATTIYCDNSSAIKLSKNPVLHGRSKHIDVKVHFLRDLTKEGVIDLIYCRNEDQVADIFTKPLKKAAFQKLRKLLGVGTLQAQIFCAAAVVCARPECSCGIGILAFDETWLPVRCSLGVITGDSGVCAHTYANTLALSWLAKNFGRHVTLLTPRLFYGISVLTSSTQHAPPQFFVDIVWSVAPFCIPYVLREHNNAGNLRPEHNPPNRDMEMPLKSPNPFGPLRI